MAVEDKVYLMPGYILCRADEAPGMIGEIALPTLSAQRPVSGIVLKASPELAESYPSGRRVVFGSFGGEDLKVDGQIVKLIHENEVNCWIEGEEPA